MTDSPRAPERLAKRKRIRWEAVRGPRAVGALIVGTSLGAGLFPLAPGTMGALFGVPIAFFTADWPWPARVAFWIAMTAIGTWSARVLDEVMGTSDNQSIVIDEVIGLGITAWTAGHGWPALLASFLLFRLFDIWKPFPVRLIDAWSKKKAADLNDPAARWWGGFGVMADDIAAGLQGLLVVVTLQYFRVI